MKIVKFVLPAFLVLGLAACGDDHDHDHGEGHDHKHEQQETKQATQKAAESADSAAHDDHKHDDEKHAEKAAHEDHGHDDHKHAEEKTEHGDHDHKEHHDHDHDGERKDHAAHEHGAARLTVAVNDSGLEVMLETPAANVFGFEHQAETDEDKQAVSTAKAKLEGVFAPNSDAACKLASHAVDASDEQEGHSDVGASWTFTCANPDKLSSLGVQLFSAFPQGFKHVNAEWVTAAGAGAKELEQDATLQLR